MFCDQTTIFARHYLFLTSFFRNIFPFSPDGEPSRTCMVGGLRRTALMKKYLLPTSWRLSAERNPTMSTNPTQIKSEDKEGRVEEAV
jgi:hypothetical protein